MTTTRYNDFGAEMIENRPTMAALDLDTMTKAERKTYLFICDQIAASAFAYIANSNPDNFPAFRSALHALFTFVEADTKILALDAYSVRFIPAVVPYRIVKSKEYKTAEKAVKLFKRAMAWAALVSGVNEEDPASVLFPNASDTDSMQAAYYTVEVQEYYNACIRFCLAAWKNGVQLTMADLQAELVRLETVLADLAAQPWNFYKDFKNPMQSTTGKTLPHVPTSIRKNIEDTMADLLTQRALMTDAQLEKEEAQIKGGKKQAKAAKEASK